MTDTLRAVVEAQAAARISGDTATFASYMTPQATLELRDPALADVGRGSYNLLEVEEDGADGRSVVRYSGPGSFVLRQAWELRGRAWVCIAAEATVVSLPLARRVMKLFRRSEKRVERSDLS